jgi:hypothetical protein
MPSPNLVIYHYFEKDASYRDNFLHFLVFGVETETDYLVVISGDYSLDLPILPNVRYLFTPPKKSDFGGYAHVINTGLDLGSYEHIFFINSSVRGPFLPPYSGRSWTHLFLEQMQEDVGMVGTSICTIKADFRHSLNYQARYGGTPPYSHVQTMAYALRRPVLEKLIEQGFYEEERDATKTLAIENYEIHLSQSVLKFGWNLRSLLPELNTIDYRLPHTNPNPSSTMGDPNEVLGYFGRSVHPYEGVFIKTNRHLYTEAYLARLSYSIWQIREAMISPALVTSPAIADYLKRITTEACSREIVSDFSYLPGAIEAQNQLHIALQESKVTQEQYLQMRNSTSWKITALLRALKDWLSGSGKK